VSQRRFLHVRRARTGQPRMHQPYGVRNATCDAQDASYKIIQHATCIPQRTSRIAPNRIALCMASNRSTQVGGTVFGVVEGAIGGVLGGIYGGGTASITQARRSSRCACCCCVLHVKCLYAASLTHVCLRASPVCTGHAASSHSSPAVRTTFSFGLLAGDVSGRARDLLAWLVTDGVARQGRRRSAACRDSRD